MAPQLLDLDGSRLARLNLRMQDVLALLSHHAGANVLAVHWAREFEVRLLVQLLATPNPTNAEPYDAAWDDVIRMNRCPKSW